MITLNIAFIGIREDEKKTTSAPKKIANTLYNELKKTKENLFFYSLNWDDETHMDLDNINEVRGDIKGIKQFLIKNKIEVVYLARYYSKLALYLVWLKKLLKFKLVYTVHGIIKKEADINKSFGKISIFFERILLSNCDKIIVVSEASKDELIKYYPSIIKENIEVINNGVSVFDPEDNFDIVKEVGLDPSKKIILSIGTRKIKNIELLLESFAKDKQIHNNTNLVVIGEVDTEYVKGLMEEYKQFENLKFISYMEPKYLYALYKSCDMYIQISKFETFGMSIAEALLFKKQVLIEKELPIAKYFTEKEVTFYDSDKDELNIKIKQVLSQSNKDNIEGYNRATELFCWNEVATRYSKVFTNVL